MSTFGVILILIFMVLIGGLVTFLYNGSDNVVAAKAMLCALYLLILVEFFIAIAKYPCYIVDGIVFVSMGYMWLANVMFAIAGGILLFALIMLLCRFFRWRGALCVTPAKLIVCGILLISLFAYTELFNGASTFDSYQEFREAKAMHEQYDVHFWPTKYVKHYSNINNRECVAVYPFDVKAASKDVGFAYRVDTFIEKSEDGSTHYYFFPFSWKAYEGSKAVDFNDATYIPQNTKEEPREEVSSTDTSSADTAETSADGQQ